MDNWKRKANIYIYKSNWIPKPDHLKPISIQTLQPNFVVANLISNQTWKEYLISQNFIEDDAARIKRIILLSSPKSDQLIWHFDKHGNYSVKSGYQLALKLKSLDFASRSDMQKHIGRLFGQRKSWKRSKFSCGG